MTLTTFISNLQTDSIQVQNDDAITVLAGGKLRVDGTALEIISDQASTTVTVRAGGLIDGTENAVNFVNDGISSGTLVNRGVLSSDSRVVNIGGQGIQIINSGFLFGTDNQRNGVIYSDGSANNFLIHNLRRGTIDAGQNNQGAAISLQLGATPNAIVQAKIKNTGVIHGRGQAESSSALAGDGIRLFPGLGTTIFQGEINNRGRIISDSNIGVTSAIRISDGLSFQGRIQNRRTGTIAGGNNGLYLGDAEHDILIRNNGKISSDSRALNLDGSGIHLINQGVIVGTGNQRNGTIYADGTADNYVIHNGRRGLIDAGKGNQGAAISLQLGEQANDVVHISIKNAGFIQGRGKAVSDSPLAGDGIRLFSGVANGLITVEGEIRNEGSITATHHGISVDTGIILEGDLRNLGSLTSTAGSGIAIDGEISGDIINRGSISGHEYAINGEDSQGSLSIRNFGDITGEIVLSSFDDSLDASGGSIQGEIFGLSGDDTLTGSQSDDYINGGKGNDQLTGSGGKDIFAFEVFGTGQDQDLVTDFTVGQDRIDLSALNLGISELQTLLSHGMQVNQDVLLGLTPNQDVLLQDVSLRTLDATSFIL